MVPFDRPHIATITYQSFISTVSLYLAPFRGYSGIYGISRNLNRSRDPEQIPIGYNISCLHLGMNQHTKFKDPSFIDSEDKTVEPKFKKNWSRDSDHAH